MITDKDQMFRAYAAGELGNRLRYWPTLQDYYNDLSYVGPVGLRYRVPGSPWMTTDLPNWLAVIATVQQWIGEPDFNPKLVTVSENSVYRHQRVNAELVDTVGGWALLWSPFPRPMRTALAIDGRLAYGLEAKLIIDHFLDPPSLDNLHRLLEQYPDHAIELTAFDRGVGILGLNTVFWEVRHY